MSAVKAEDFLPGSEYTSLMKRVGREEKAGGIGWRERERQGEPQESREQGGRRHRRDGELQKTDTEGDVQNEKLPSILQ